ncbi:MAG: COX15/CtaA family protein [Acidimicrobiia bacterium]
MRVPSLSPVAFRRITLVAALALAGIIVTGGAVRLTGSGLGCSDWPACEPGRPVAPLEYHALVEFVNRMVTGLVSVVVIVAVLGSLIRRPRRAVLVWLSLGLVAGVVGQIVLGGLTVLFELRPELVMSHFLLSMVLLADAVVLYHRAGLPDGEPTRPLVGLPVRVLGWVLVLAASVVLFTGTIVTAAGPHGGDEEVPRLSVYVPAAARVHGTSAMIVVALILVTFLAVYRDHSPARVQHRLGVLLAVVVVQGTIGYVQYLNEIPPRLVALHIAGATAVWAATLWFLLGLSAARAPVKTPPVRAPGPELARV